MSADEEVQRLRRELEEMKKRMQKLENHVNHPPRIAKLLEHIREKRVVTIEELRQVFPKLWGGNLSQLYDAVRSDSSFIVLESKTRWNPSIIAYFGDPYSPDTATLKAVDLFQRISQRSSKKDTTIDDIMNIYNTSLEEANQVYDEVLRLFERQIETRKNASKGFRKKKT